MSSRVGSAMARKSVQLGSKGVRRVPLHAVDLMLFGTVLLWALNTTVTRYVLTHGFRPLAYSTTRYAAATALFWAFTYSRERSFWIARRDLRYVAFAGLMIFTNQLCFVYAIDKTTASTVTLFLAATPIFIGTIAATVGLEHMRRSFWFGTVVSLIGVGFVASGSGGFSGNVVGDGLALLTALTWAGYSIAITPLMRSYSPSRISAVVLSASWLPVAIVGWPQTSSQDWSLGWEIWALFAFATLGPLVVTNVLWFRSLDKIGPARATLATNLQPFVAAVFAVVLLSETLSAVQVAGGILIAAGILLARRRGAPAAPGE